jgi:hypothetical protein
VPWLEIYVTSLPGIADDIGWESVAFPGVHPPILSISGSLLADTCYQV